MLKYIVITILANLISINACRAQSIVKYNSRHLITLDVLDSNTGEPLSDYIIRIENLYDTVTLAISTPEITILSIDSIGMHHVFIIKDGYESGSLSWNQMDDNSTQLIYDFKMKKNSLNDDLNAKRTKTRVKRTKYNNFGFYTSRLLWISRISIETRLTIIDRN